MINRDFIEELKIKWQTSDINVLREYIQHLFLSHLYRRRETKDLLFKGGTTLRILYRSPRFSEDLDFSSKIYSASRIEDLIEEVLLQLSREGIRLEITEAKETTGGYLFDSKTRIYEREIGIKLNFVVKKNLKGELIIVQSAFIPPYTVVSLRQIDLIGEKIQAFLTRGKARDFFDLYFIIRANLGGTALSKNYAQIVKKIENSKDTFSELKTFLPRSFWPIVKDLRKNLLSELRPSHPTGGQGRRICYRL